LKKRQNCTLTLLCHTYIILVFVKTVDNNFCSFCYFPK
jgi:hypothetical protein